MLSTTICSFPVYASGYEDEYDDDDNYDWCEHNWFRERKVVRRATSYRKGIITKECAECGKVFTIQIPRRKKDAHITPQSKVTDASKVLSSCSLYNNELSLEFDNLEPDTTYRIYRREAKKKWKIINTFYVEEEDLNGNYEPYHEYIDKRVKSNTHYYYKLYACETGEYSKTESYWTPCKHPKNIKQSGQFVRWDKTKGARGYFIVYYKKYKVWSYSKDDYIVHTDSHCELIHPNKNYFNIPNGYKLDGVCAYTKHKGLFYVDWVGTYKNESILKRLSDFAVEVVKKKIRY